MIDLSNEKTITLTAATKIIPPKRTGRPVSDSCVYRWISEGVRGPDGKRIRLEAVHIAGRWLTSVAARAVRDRADTAI